MHCQMYSLHSVTLVVNIALLPPANEVWGKVLHLSVNLFTGGMYGWGGGGMCGWGVCSWDMCVHGWGRAWLRHVWLGACMTDGGVCGWRTCMAGGGLV